jgi:hypothetical protein
MPRDEDGRPKRRKPGKDDSPTDLRPRVKLVGGKLPRIVAQILALMRLDGAVYDRAGELVRIVDGTVYLVKSEWLVNYLSDLINFLKFDARSNEWRSVNCPTDIARTVMAMNGEWRFRPLDGVIRTPTITRDGRVIDSPGYDAQTRLYIHTADDFKMHPTPKTPTVEDAAQAVQELWRPFKDFPFASPTDRGGYLAALLTVVTRPLLPSAPGFLISSPVAGSGKTLLANCLSALANQPIEVLPKIEEDEEMRKRLVALSRVAMPIICLDNISGRFKSDALCAFLTCERMTDRILGVSEMISVRTAATIVATGNNPIVEGDLNRRLIVIKIDPACEKPFDRKFDLNPLQYVRDNLAALVRASIVILQASVAAGTPHGGGGFASFEGWEFIRNSVCFCSNNKLLDVDDPVESAKMGYLRDPETTKLGALLSVWNEYFGRDGITVAKAIRLSLNNRDSDLFGVLDEVAGEKGGVNPRRLGRWIERNEKRIVDGMLFERVRIEHKGIVWRSALQNAKKWGVRGVSHMCYPQRVATVIDSCSGSEVALTQNTRNPHCGICRFFDVIKKNSGEGICEGYPFDGKIEKKETDGNGCSSFLEMEGNPQ